MSIPLVVQCQRVQTHVGNPLEGSTKSACEGCSQPVWVAEPTRNAVREIVAHGGQAIAFCEECRPANVVTVKPEATP